MCVCVCVSARDSDAKNIQDAQKNRRSDGSMKCVCNFIGNYDWQTNRQNNLQTNEQADMRVHRDVKLPKMNEIKIKKSHYNSRLFFL